jgi:hypothetical protein
MIGNYFARLTGSKRNLLALLASSAVLTAGCANMSSTAPTANPFDTSATLKGSVHGGNQPVIGATVTLWFASQGGPAVPATKAATTTTDSLGSFSFVKGTPGDGTTNNYICPTSGGSPLVYVTSKGGNTQNNGSTTQNNSAAAFIALYGDCSGIGASNFVYMSEVTTVATMATVQQFFNPTDDSLRADGTGQQRLIILNLPHTVALLVDAATGLAKSSTIVPAASSGNIASGVTLTASPETAKINTIANIISACVNGATSADPACATLFSAAPPPQGNTTSLNPPGGSFPAATDTLQALYYIFTNPTNSLNSTNMSNLFGLQPAVGAPYQPSLVSSPTDWTIGVSYFSASSCTTGNFISSPTDINIDGSNNVWFGNAQTGGNLSAISATGAPLNCINFDPGASSTGGTLDSAGNVWLAGGTTLYRYNPNSKASLAFPVGVTPLALTADGAGNVYFTAVAGSTGSAYQLLAAATTSAAVAPLQISNLVGASPVRMMADNTSATPTTTPGNIWVASGSSFVSQLSPTTATSGAVLNGFLTTTFSASGFGNASGISLDHNSDVFVSAIDTGFVGQLTRAGSNWAPTTINGWPFLTPNVAGVNGPKGIAADGRANIWIPNSGSSSISEISFGASALSPSTGFRKDPTFLNASNAIAIDQAGNVWVAGTGNSFVTEIVGAGVPVYAPYAIGIGNGRFQAIP